MCVVTCSKAPSFPDTTRAKQLRLADYVFTGFFTVEALLKVGAWGFILAPNTYLRSGELCGEHGGAEEGGEKWIGA